MMTDERDAFWQRIIYITSAVVCAAVAFLILGPRPEGVAGGLDVSGLPAVNATLNALSGLLLLTGLAMIKTGRRLAHRRAMLAAFASSAAFLVSYVVYHWYKAGPRPYEGEFKALYLSLLASHVVLAAVIMPLALLTLYRGWTDQLQAHRRIARVTLPLWLYVSATGVTIYFMLY